MKNLLNFPPHFRLIALFVLSIGMSAIANPLWLAMLILLLTLMLSINIANSADHCFRQYIKNWLKLNIFSLLIWLTLSWEINQNGILLSPIGIQLALLISLRMNAILLLSWLMLFKINETKLLQAISKLPLPNKLIYLFVLTLRYIQLFSDLKQKRELALQARGYHPKFSWHSLKISAQMVALLLIQAMIKAETSSWALKSRGFDLENKK